MGLFTGAITFPLRVARAGAAEMAGGAATALRMIEDVLREDSPEVGSPDVAPPPPPRARRPARRRARPRAERRRREAPHVRPAPPPPEAKEGHVDTGVTPVAEISDREAREGAGPEIEVSEPWDGYGGSSAREVVAALDSASSEALAAVRLYEQAHRRRRSVLDAVDRALTAR